MKPEAPTKTTESLPNLIPLPDTLKVPLLREAIQVYNGAVTLAADKTDPYDAFPEDLTQEICHTQLLGHLGALTTLGTLRGDVHTSVVVRDTAIEQGDLIYSRALLLINSRYPVGSAKRGDFFPLGDTNPNLGDLLQAAGRGAVKHKLRLPLGYTGQSLTALGVEVSAALVARDAKGTSKTGQAAATAGFIKKTKEIRKRLREAVVGWLGPSAQELVAYGIKPRKPRAGGRKAKVTPPATEPTP